MSDIFDLMLSIIVGWFSLACSLGAVFFGHVVFNKEMWEVESRYTMCIFCVIWAIFTSLFILGMFVLQARLTGG